MSLFSPKPPWYVMGLAFECQQCGRCCSGPEEGYVWVTDREVAVIAEHLNISELEMHRRYLRRVGRRFTIVEDGKTRDCIFLTPQPGGGKGCSIYAIRPSQCRTWPFWRMNVSDGESWARAGMRCRGINRGKLFTCDEIDNIAQNSNE